MEKNKLTDFIIIWNEDKAALIDPINKVCLGVSNKIAENLEDKSVIKKIYPIWKQQVELQNEIVSQQHKINTLYLMVTRKCNMNCDFCAINANQNMKLDQEIKIEDVRQKVIPFLKKYNPHKIIITGGEPLIKEKIQEIIAEIHHEMDSFIILQSNGLNIDNELLDGIANNVDEIDFSTKHMFQSIEKETELKNHIKMVQARGMEVVLSFIYDRENKEDLYKVIDIAAEYNTELLINIVASIGRAKDNRQQILTEYEKMEMNLDVAQYIYLKNYIEKKLFSFMLKNIQVQNSCGAYGRVIAVFPEGHIYMCQCLEKNKFRIGNVLNDDVDKLENTLDILMDKEYIKKSFCVDAKEICKDCNYRYLCGGICPASTEENDFECYFRKKMIEFKLFCKNGENKKLLLEEYIKYLMDIKKDYTEKVQLN
ncbi:radical SAM protein with 4Fe4S-binding SPASM domain [Lachnotalea glycerini]|uniref:Radical SAM protein n=1 Tax=Lachnotalea glycerini TaxID=1763509 RepID=A0A255ID55_9FIRM|nr:radical SAM protein [Lachnotalea glycerini]PXV93356.1 radical SAM protein with 4Fe4S-binding SPASM domain [Lachnotalea glycerini]RDY32028.1 radical SAM protein [Lachnotalea glycerini]